MSDPTPIPLRPQPTLDPRADQLVWRFFNKTVLLIAEARTSLYPPTDQGRRHESGHVGVDAIVPDTLPGASTTPADATTTLTYSVDAGGLVDASRPVKQQAVSEEKPPYPKLDKWVRVAISLQFSQKARVLVLTTGYQFNLDLPRTDTFKSTLSTFRYISSTYPISPPDVARSPPPLIAQVLLSIPPASLDLNHVLVLSHMSNRTRLDPIPRYILLESWRINLVPPASPGDTNATPLSEIELPQVYKASIALFRSLYTLLRVLPSWKLLRKFRQGSGGNMAIQLRVDTLDTGFKDLPPFIDGIPVVDFGAELSSKPSANEIKSFSVPSISTPLGELRLSLEYRPEIDFYLVTLENLLSSGFAPAGRKSGRDGPPPELLPVLRSELPQTQSPSTHRAWTDDERGNEPGFPPPLSISLPASPVVASRTRHAKESFTEKINNLAQLAMVVDGLPGATASSGSPPRAVGHRRYSRRSDTASSSRSSRSPSVSSAFRERFTSSSSDELPEHLRRHLPTDGSTDQLPKVKRPKSTFGFTSTYGIALRARNKFKQLVSTGSEASFARVQRKEGAEGLVQLMETYPSGSKTVLRRFTKSDSRIKQGLSSVLRFFDEEAEARDTSADSAAAPQLLQLLHQNLNLFHDLIPAHLTSGVTYGAAGIRYLLHFTLDSRVPSPKEITLLLRFITCILKDNPHTASWKSVHAISLLEFIVRHHSELVKTVLNSAINDDLPQVLFGDTFKRMIPGRLHVDSPLQRRCQSAVLQLVRTTHANIGSPVASTAPTSRGGLGSTVTAIAVSCQLEESTDSHQAQSGPSSREARSLRLALGPKMTQPSLQRCLALAALVGLLDVPETREEIVGGSSFCDALFDECLDVMLLRTDWQFDTEEDCMEEDIPKLIPHEDAYDIIRKLSLHERLTEALSLLFKTTLAARQKDEPKYEEFKLLEPLLWWSRMPHQEMKHAVMAAGGFNFLAVIANMDVPDLEVPEYRLIYRAKGDAITCMGNFFESMDAEERALFVSPHMTENIRQTAMNEEFPLTLRHQAAFALQRYNGEVP